MATLKKPPHGNATTRWVAWILAGSAAAVAVGGVMTGNSTRVGLIEGNSGGTISVGNHTVNSGVDYNELKKISEALRIERLSSAALSASCKRLAAERDGLRQERVNLLREKSELTEVVDRAKQQQWMSGIPVALWGVRIASTTGDIRSITIGEDDIQVDGAHIDQPIFVLVIDHQAKVVAFKLVNVPAAPLFVLARGTVHLQQQPDAKWEIL